MDEGLRADRWLAGDAKAIRVSGSMTRRISQGKDADNAERWNTYNWASEEGSLSVTAEFPAWALALIIIVAALLLIVIVLCLLKCLLCPKKKDNAVGGAASAEGK